MVVLWINVIDKIPFKKPTYLNQNIIFSIALKVCGNFFDFPRFAEGGKIGHYLLLLSP
jgi:hypothetical protein